MRISFLFLLLLLQSFLYSQQECMEGKEYPEPVLSENARTNHLRNLQQAAEALIADSTNADKIIWFGRRSAYLGEYDRAIAFYSIGIALHPNDARMYRHRGHRYITLRCFDKAIADLEKAASLIQGKPDEVEPDGIPNEKNIPTSTLQTNTWYHLGLAYFLKGEFGKAEMAYSNGLAVSLNEDMYIAMANWLYIALLSQHKTTKADSIYNTVNQNARLIENADYLTLLYLYRHKPAENELNRYMDAVIMRSAGKMDTTSVSAATLFFGAGYYARLKGMPQKAALFFEKALATRQWSSFGAATNNNAEQMGLRWNTMANNIVSTQNNFTVSIIGYSCGQPLEADVRCGTAPFTFKWEYSINSGQSWTQFGTTEMVSTSGLCNLTTGVLIIRLTVTDAANRVRQAHKIYGIGGYRLADTGNISDLKIIPNPTVNNTVVNFSLLEEAEITVTVKNNYGIEIINMPARRYGKGNNQVNLNFNKLTPGIYLVSLISKTEIKSSYIIKY